jgi:cytosine/adenosine deaminase-related metal-dependent hydrolase
VVSSPIVDGAVAVESGRIVAVGHRRDIESLYGAATYNHAGVLTPGLVNAHTHLQLTSYADMATLGVPFAEWIALFFGRYRVTTGEEWLASARDGVREVLAGGTTSTRTASRPSRRPRPDSGACATRRSWARTTTGGRNCGPTSKPGWTARTRA